MMSIFTKKAQNHTGLVALLRARGMHIPNEKIAEQALQTIGYYRLSGYTLLVETVGVFTRVGANTLYARSHTFQKGASFQQLLGLYTFDQHLRSVVLDALFTIEIATRTIINNHMALIHQDPHWYTNPIHFQAGYTSRKAGKSNHDKFLEEIERETGKNKLTRRTAFTTYYYTKFSSPPLPPAWMVAEQISFGSWSVIYSQLNSSRDRKDIAQQFNVSPDELKSWLRALSYLRNLCAHQNRLLGINFIHTPNASSKLPVGIRNTDFAAYTAIIHYLLREIEPSNIWIKKLKELFARHRSINKQTLLGFFPNWSRKTFWRPQ